MMNIFSIPPWLLFMTARSIKANSNQLENMLAKIEFDTYTFAHKMEDLIMDKCNFTSDETCYKASYHSCDSELPYATCPGNDYAIGKCGSGKEGGCGGLFDFTTSVVSVAPVRTRSGQNTLKEANDDRVKDGVCSTLRAEQYMIDTTKENKSYWDDLGVFSPALYYGTDDG